MTKYLKRSTNAGNTRVTMFIKIYRLWQIHTSCLLSQWSKCLTTRYSESAVASVGMISKLVWNLPRLKLWLRELYKIHPFLLVEVSSSWYTTHYGLGIGRQQYHKIHFRIERIHALSALSSVTASILNIFYILCHNLPNRITRSHSDPLRYGPILLQLLCKFPLNPECLMRRL